MHWIIVNKDDDNGDDDHGEDDHNGQGDSRVRRPSARLLGPAPASENLETAPERRPPVRPIRFSIKEIPIIRFSIKEIIRFSIKEIPIKVAF